MAGILKEKSFDFALRVISIYKTLVEDKREYILSKQLLRSGTSIGAMVREAQNAESKLDFIHKLAIAQKETDETLYWLELMFKSEYIQQQAFENLYLEAEAILKIIRSSILTVKKNIKKPK